MRLMGLYPQTMDNKGRTSVPAPIRDELAKQGIELLVVTNDTVGEHDCLVVYPEPEWEKFIRKFERLPEMDPHVEAFHNHFIAPAQPVGMDGQGRILVPQTLREEIGLNGKVVVVAAGDKFRIWDADVWAQVRKDSKARFAESKRALAEKLS